MKYFSAFTGIGGFDLGVPQIVKEIIKHIMGYGLKQETLKWH